jgi:hypothetical protein
MRVWMAPFCSALVLCERTSAAVNVLFFPLSLVSVATPSPARIHSLTVLASPDIFICVKIVLTLQKIPVACCELVSIIVGILLFVAAFVWSVELEK